MSGMKQGSARVAVAAGCDPGPPKPRAARPGSTTAASLTACSTIDGSRELWPANMRTVRGIDFHMMSASMRAQRAEYIRQVFEPIAAPAASRCPGQQARLGSHDTPAASTRRRTAPRRCRGCMTPEPRAQAHRRETRKAHRPGPLAAGPSGALRERPACGWATGRRAGNGAAGVRGIAPTGGAWGC